MKLVKTTCVESYIHRIDNAIYSNVILLIYKFMKNLLLALMQPPLT